MKSYPFAAVARSITDPAILARFCFNAHRRPLTSPQKLLMRLVG